MEPALANQAPGESATRSAEKTEKRKTRADAVRLAVRVARMATGGIEVTAEDHGCLPPVKDAPRKGAAARRPAWHPSGTHGSRIALRTSSQALPIWIREESNYLAILTHWSDSRRFLHPKLEVGSRN